MSDEAGKAGDDGGQELPAQRAPAGTAASEALSPAPVPSSAPPPPRARRGSRRRADPWAHRRGEPRIFAFLWTLFLFAATGFTFMAAVSMGGTSADVMRPATRALLAVTVAGVVLIWPMVRLSQTPDEHPAGGILQDLVVVLIPTQAVIWPQWLGWLGRWPPSVVGAVAVLVIAWGLLTGGVLAVAQVLHRRAAAGYGRFTPWAWMALFVLLAAGGMVPAIFAATAPPPPDGVPPDFRASWMLSPLTAIYEITRDRSWSGVSAAVSPSHWWMIGLTGAASLPPWILAVAWERGMRVRRGLH